MQNMMQKQLLADFDIGQLRLHRRGNRPEIADVIRNRIQTAVQPVHLFAAQRVHPIVICRNLPVMLCMFNHNAADLLLLEQIVQRCSQTGRVTKNEPDCIPGEHSAFIVRKSGAFPGGYIQPFADIVTSCRGTVLPGWRTIEKMLKVEQLCIYRELLAVKSIGGQGETVPLLVLI
ncbi:hypothetical protein D3C73_524530 [compost metagenome]